MENYYLNKPPLFHGIQFYVIDNDDDCHTVYDMTLNGKDLKLLIEIGGGTVLRRLPALYKLLNHSFHPYHLNIGRRRSRCCHFAIFGKKQKMRKHPHLKYKPSKWLVDSIRNFRIESV